MAGPPAATGTDHPAAAGTSPATSGGRGRRQDLRGSGHHPRLPVHLLAAMDHTSRAVLAQTEVDAKTNESA